MSNFLTVIKNIFSPVVQEAVAFGHILETEVEGAETTDIAGAFTAGYTAFSATIGTFEDKAIAAITAFGSTLLGYAITIVEQAAKDTAASDHAV